MKKDYEFNTTSLQIVNQMGAGHVSAQEYSEIHCHAGLSKSHSFSNDSYLFPPKTQHIQFQSEYITKYLQFQTRKQRKEAHIHFNDLIISLGESMIANYKQKQQHINVTFPKDFWNQENIEKLRALFAYIDLYIRKQTNYKFYGITHCVRNNKDQVNLCIDKINPTYQFSLHIAHNDVVRSLTNFFKINFSKIQHNTTYEVVFDSIFYMNPQQEGTLEEMEDFQVRDFFQSKRSDLSMAIQLLVKLFYGPNYNCLIYFTNIREMAFDLLIFNEQDYSTDQQPVWNMCNMLYKGNKQVQNIIQLINAENSQLNIHKHEMHFVNYIVGFSGKSIKLEPEKLEDMQQCKIKYVQIKSIGLSISEYLNPMNFNKQLAHTNHQPILDLLNVEVKKDFTEQQQEILEETLLNYYCRFIYKQHQDVKTTKLNLGYFINAINVERIQTHLSQKYDIKNISISQEDSILRFQQ